jgi:tetratricopeptide (TPR) repeat protein
MDRQRRDLKTLVRDVEWALANNLEARELVEMLKKMVAQARAGSPESLFGKLKIAELVVTDSPWKAAVLARSVVTECRDGRAWAVLGLAHSMLGNFRAAVKAYRRALLLAPGNPWIMHNLGHLLDVALARPFDGLKYLDAARQALPTEPEIISSYAHALLRVGRRAEAHEMLRRGLEWDEARVDRQLEAWLNLRVAPG